MIIFVALVVGAGIFGVQAQEAQQPAQPAQQAAQGAPPSAPDEARAREPRVGLNETATAYDLAGRAALAGRLRTQQLAGTQDAPVRDVLIMVENRSGVFYNYASGWATFYDAAGVRCGAGAWKVEAFAPGESAEVDMPGLRLTCTPSTWRLAALDLLARAADIAKSETPLAANVGAQPGANVAQSALAPAAQQRLEININGKTLPLQLNNPVDVVVGKERVLIVVRPAP